MNRKNENSGKKEAKEAKNKTERTRNGTFLRIFVVCKLFCVCDQREKRGKPTMRCPKDVLEATPNGEAGNARRARVARNERVRKKWEKQRAAKRQSAGEKADNRANHSRADTRSHAGRQVAWGKADNRANHSQADTRTHAERQAAGQKAGKRTNHSRADGRTHAE